MERAADESHAAGMLSFPGGKVEDPPADDDVLAATAQREVREEVGVEVEAVEYVTCNTSRATTGSTC